MAIETYGCNESKSVVPIATQPAAVGGSPKPNEKPPPPTQCGSLKAEGLGDGRKPLTPKQIEKIKILDPACGSGSFLLGAYTYLLNYHRDWTPPTTPEKWAKKKDPLIYQVDARPGGSLPQGGDGRPTARHCEEDEDPRGNLKPLTTVRHCEESPVGARPPRRRKGG